MEIEDKEPDDFDDDEVFKAGDKIVICDNCGEHVDEHDTCRAGEDDTDGILTLASFVCPGVYDG